MAKKDHPAMNVHVPRKGTKIGSIIGTFILKLWVGKLQANFHMKKKLLLLAPRIHRIGTS